ncbi:MAG: 3-hydroxyacyl-ACP dehydratase FabZ family protein [Pirellulaceae bacterium]|nr:3-hydroxyacyl-ACP dehydratase FabZ family protein [Pirellulaceae bacterium]
MRWFWIDKFEEFVRGERAVAIKAIGTCEEQFDGYCPGFPIMPQALIIEGMAQTAGLLIGEIGGYQQRVVLAKVGKAVFHGIAQCGDVLRYEAKVLDVKTDGAMCAVNGFIGEQLQAEVEMMFAFLDDRFPSGPLFEPVDFLLMLRSFCIYDVGRTPDGQPLEIPAFYLDAERAAQASYAPIPSPVLPSADPAIRH